MIDPRAVDDYLRQRRDSFVWVKSLSRKQLWEILDDADFRPCSDKPLDKHQLACIVLGIAYSRFCFWLDMGTGKTRIVLELLNHYWRKGELHRALILAISDEAVGGWEDEIKKWNFRVPYSAIGNSATSEKWQAIAEMGAGILITTYAGFNYMFSERVKAKKGSSKKKMVPDKKRIASFAKNLDAFIPDESVHLGNHRSLGFRIAKPLSKPCKIVWPLAGVPFGRDPTLAWSQHYLADRGESLGAPLGVFRSAFFTEKENYFGGYDYKFKEETRSELTRLMQHRSISYGFEECGDLPPVRAITHNIKLPKETMLYFDQAMDAIRKARGDKKQIENIFLRMRQLSSGFIGYRDDETGARAQLVLPKNPKLDDLVNTLCDIPPDCKFVIFHEFTFSGHQIVKAFAERGKKIGWLWSGEKNGKLVKKRFDTESPKKMPGLLVNHFLGAESLNLQRANYVYVYESPVSVIKRKQMERRCFRKGQELPGFLIDPIATKVDARIRQFHAEGGDLFRALIRDPFRALG